MNVALLFDLVTRSGEKCLEVRLAQEIANGYFAGAKYTVYSCAYTCDLGRKVALARAHEFCNTSGYQVVHYGDADSNRRAAWQ